VVTPLRPISIENVLLKRFLTFETRGYVFAGTQVSFLQLLKCDEQTAGDVVHSDVHAQLSTRRERTEEGLTKQVEALESIRATIHSGDNRRLLAERKVVQDRTNKYYQDTLDDFREMASTAEMRELLEKLPEVLEAMAVGESVHVLVNMNDPPARSSLLQPMHVSACCTRFVTQSSAFLPSPSSHILTSPPYCRRWRERRAPPRTTSTW